MRPASGIPSRRAVIVVAIVSATVGPGACTPAKPRVTETSAGSLPVPGQEALDAGPRVLRIPPAAGLPHEVIVLLHGLGADASSFQHLAAAIAPSFPHAELLTPDGFEAFDQGPSGRQWFSSSDATATNRSERVRAAGMAVSTWIDAQLAARALPPGRVVIVGFSQGAVVGAWLAVHRQPSPAAVVMFSGRVAAGETPVSPPVATPVFWAHGEADARIPIALQGRGTRILQASGAQVTTRAYPGLGHTIEPHEVDEAVAFLRTILPD